ncbi:diacylglycerol kinase family protein [Thomasclavelia sp.]
MKQELKKRINSFKYAIEGIVTTFKLEMNMKIHIIIMTAVIITGVILKLSILEWKICIILFSLVIAAELFNTAIEAVVDMIMPEFHPKAKIAKDAAAGGVLVLAIGAAIVGLIIFIPKFIELI